MQFIFALITLETQWGYDAFKWVGDRVTEFLVYSDVGAEFVFGTVFAEHLFAFKVCLHNEAMKQLHVLFFVSAVNAACAVIVHKGSG